MVLKYGHHNRYYTAKIASDVSESLEKWRDSQGESGYGLSPTRTMKRCLIPSVINSKLERYFFIVASLIVVLHGDGNSTLLSIVLTKLEEESR